MGQKNRHGGVRKSNKKGPTKGTGNKGRRALQGKGPTPKAENREYHKAYKAKQEKMRRDQGRHYKKTTVDELVVGRNPVVECLTAKVPAQTLYVVEGTAYDERLNQAVTLAKSAGVTILEVPRAELDKMTGNGLHQGIGLLIEPFRYTEVEDLISGIAARQEPGMVVCLDNITDPRNLGAIIRSVAAFGAHGVVIPERRSAHVTGVTWRSSAGTAARVPVAKATNMTRAVQTFQRNGYQVVGLDAGGEHTLDTYDGTTPVVIVVGSEGKGISRLVKDNCDTIMSIPMTDWVESLNAAVATGAVLSEFARQRRTQK